MNLTYNIKRAEIYRISIFLLISLIMGILFGSLLDIELTIDKGNITTIDIFLNNLMIGLALVFLTSFVSYPIILFNGFFLGLNIFFAVQLFGSYKTFLTLIFHTPLEMFAWVICIIASKRMFIFYKDLLKKQFNLEALRYVFKFTGGLIVIYLVAAIIEYNAFHLLGGSKWLN
ncbi:stage II sporulation protein M [Paenibacillus pinihumi]|uniref:stage II sporulation protein M n=1 Tax=Paenibacillus pinihumi TaxID=669462 RepID=UPI00048ACFBB|nr:stage II sporulation protein M [Paenibacillus pinihumi]